MEHEFNKCKRVRIFKCEQKGSTNSKPARIIITDLAHKTRIQTSIIGIPQCKAYLQGLGLKIECDGSDRGGTHYFMSTNFDTPLVSSRKLALEIWENCCYPWEALK